MTQVCFQAGPKNNLREYYELEKEPVYVKVEILYNKEKCHLQLKRCRFIRLFIKFYYKSGQRSADFITVASGPNALQLSH